MKWLETAAVVAALAVGFGACTKSPGGGSTPEAALKSYVDIAFNAKSPDDGKKLLALSTGEAFDWLSSMSEDAFKKQFVDNHMSLQSFTTRDKVTDEKGDVSLVYEIAFRDGATNGDPTSQATFTNKKIAYLTKDKDSGTWKIKATKNVKTFIERKDPLEIGPSAAARPAPEAKSEDKKPEGK